MRSLRVWSGRAWSAALVVAACASVHPLLAGDAGDAKAGDAKAAGDNRVFMDGWTYSRERKTITTSNRVTINFTVKNVSGGDLENVQVQVTLFSGLGEKVAGPLSQTLGTLKPKQAAPVQVVGGMVPIFGAYEIAVTFKGGKEVWSSNSDIQNPQPKVEGLLPNTASIAVLGQEAGPNRAGQLAGQIRVKNQGALEATNVKLIVLFFAVDRTGKKVKVDEWTSALGTGKVGPGKEVTYSFTVPKPIPRNSNLFEVRASCDEATIEQQLSGGEFANIKDLEAARWEFKRVGARQEDLEVACQVRNGLAKAVEGLKLTLTFLATDKGTKVKVKSHTEEVPGALAPGAITPVQFTLRKVPKFDTYEQGFDAGAPAGGAGGGGAAGEAKAAAHPATQTPAGAAKFKNAATVEVLFKEFSTQEDGMVVVSCAARNGRPNQVRDVLITLRLLNAGGKEVAAAEKKLSEAMLPGEERPFVMRVPKGKGFASYENSVKFQEFRPEGGAGAAPAGEQTGVGTGAPPKAEPPAEKAAPPEPKAAAPEKSEPAEKTEPAAEKKKAAPEPGTVDLP
jgi:hypothetical protein